MLCRQKTSLVEKGSQLPTHGAIQWTWILKLQINIRIEIGCHTVNAIGKLSHELESRPVSTSDNHVFGYRLYIALHRHALIYLRFLYQCTFWAQTSWMLTQDLQPHQHLLYWDLFWWVSEHNFVTFYRSQLQYSKTTSWWYCQLWWHWIQYGGCVQVWWRLFTDWTIKTSLSVQWKMVWRGAILWTWEYCNSVVTKIS